MTIIKLMQRVIGGANATEERLRLINRLEPKMRKLTDDELRAKTEELRGPPAKTARSG